MDKIESLKKIFKGSIIPLIVIILTGFVVEFLFSKWVITDGQFVDAYKTLKILLPGATDLLKIFQDIAYAIIFSYIKNK